jgi:putative chitinase
MEAPVELQILSGVLLGGILGIVGQGIRIVAGLKKMLDAGSMADFKPSVLMISLLIGFIAGTLAFLGTGFVVSVQLTSQAMLGFVAAGYAGTDFIEAFMKRSG